MDYWALGHVHTRQTLREQGPAILYPGNPQGRHPNETGARGVCLVEVDDYGAVRLEFRAVDAVRWEALSLDISRLDGEQELLNDMNSLADSALEAAEGRPVMARLALTGRGPLHRWLRHADTTATILEQINDRYANAQTWLWCERIQVDTASPVDREQVAQREDFAGDLARLGGELRENPGALAELRESLRTLYVNSNAAPYLRSYLPSDEELAELLAAAEDECLASLVNGEDEA
jgi:DNA repair exonuclease SbcCD nuclease subunit